MHLSRHLVVGLLAVGSLALGIACSSSTSSSSGASGGGGGGSVPACSDICAHVGQVCGQTPATCANACAGWDDNMKTCVDGITTCDGIQSCQSSSSGDGGGGGTDSGGGGGGSTVACTSPTILPSDNKSTCAQGCLTVVSVDNHSAWCVKSCNGAGDCASTESCRQTSDLGNPKGCVPVCSSDATCSALKAGTCNKTSSTTAFCEGGPGIVL